MSLGIPAYSVRSWFCRALVAAMLLAFDASAFAGDKALRIPLPKRNKPTPVQALNRDGVKEIERHHYDKAKKLFYKAYLLDPNDPFTLNNLGYVSELEGNIDRAQRYYDLAQQQSSEAAVDLATDKGDQGKPVSKVAGNAAEQGMQINRMNVAAISLLQKDRAPEADVLLQEALTLDAKNPFTLNNLGYTKEKEGEYEAALGYYTAAANTRSTEPIVVTVNKDWRGKPISAVAEENADKLRKLMKKEETLEARVRRLNLEGVSAMNRNDRRAARQYFEQAYKLDPTDAFTMNNMGFLAELEGDRETADFYYDKAREAKRAGAKVTIATRADAEGKKVAEVAEVSNQKVEAKMQSDLERKRAKGGPVLLKRRDNTPVIEPDKAPEPLPVETRTISGPAQPAPSGRSGGVATEHPARPGAQTPQPIPQGEVMVPSPDTQPPQGKPGLRPEPSLIPPLPPDTTQQMPPR